MEYSFIDVSKNELNLESQYKNFMSESQKVQSKKENELQSFYETSQIFENQTKNDHEREYELKNKKNCKFYHDDAINQHRCQKL